MRRVGNFFLSSRTQYAAKKGTEVNDIFSGVKSPPSVQDDVALIGELMDRMTYSRCGAPGERTFRHCTRCEGVLHRVITGSRGGSLREHSVIA